MKPEIHKLIVLSTAHITAETDKELGAGQDGVTWQRVANLTETWWACFITPADAGYFIAVCSEEYQDETDDTPQCIRDVCAYARKNGCALIRIDRDGPTMNDLPTYNW